MDTPALSPFRKVLLLLLLVVAAARAADTPVYFKLGGDLKLRPAQVPANINSVSWKHNGDLVVEWVEPTVELDYWGILKNRASMDKRTGVLTITNMNTETQGLYTVEINDQLQPGGYRATVLSEVPKPEVVVRPLTCSASSERCTLSCVGDTKGAAPVNFFWKRGEEEWKEDSKDIEIINAEEETRPKTFSCRMKNPVSEQDSLALPDPFSRKEDEKPSNVAAIVAPIVTLLVFVAAALGLYFSKDKEPVAGWLTWIRSLCGEYKVANSKGDTPHREEGPTDAASVPMDENTHRREEGTTDAASVPMNENTHLREEGTTNTASVPMEENTHLREEGTTNTASVPMEENTHLREEGTTNTASG